MIDIEKYKSMMTSEEFEKIDAALIRLKTLAPDARDQILHAMELMIQCDELRRNKTAKVEQSNISPIVVNSIKINKELLLKSLKCKYSHLIKLAKMSGEITDHDRLMIAMSKILNMGTYSEGAQALDLLIKINQIHMMLDPVSHFKLSEVED